MRLKLRKYIIGAGTLGGLLLFLVPSYSSSQAADAFHVLDEISIDGPALFYGVSGETRDELWSVHCAMPLRACVARASGLVLRVDDSGNPWLIAAMGPKARVSVQARNTTQNKPELFSRALDSGTITQLADETSFVIIEENGTVVLRSRTSGLNTVVDYLTWIQGNTARTLRDARLWPRNSEIRIQDMTPEVLERYEVMQRRAVEAQRQLVPNTQPQTAFAIGGQGGDSFFNAAGRVDN